MTPKEIIEQIAEETDGEAVTFPDLEDAVVGICRRFGCPPVLLYSFDKCVDIIMRDLDADLDEEQKYLMAVEYLEFNTLGAWAGEYTPAFAFCLGEVN
jgi:hypothetical protein